VVWRADAPSVRHKITELPPPYATRSASNPPSIIAKPVSAAPKVPPGFQVELFASNLRDPRMAGQAAREAGPDRQELNVRFARDVKHSVEAARRVSSLVENRRILSQGG
jgi:hypothetical protein